jgi:glutathione S-transferase
MRVRLFEPLATICDVLGAQRSTLKARDTRDAMITLYQQHDSGNCYKVRLLLSHLERPFHTVAVSSLDGSTRKPEFLAINPIGKVPSVILDDGRFLAESNAILLHFAERTKFLPKDGYERAKTFEWLFFEQYSHEPAIAVRRALTVYSERRAAATPERMAELLTAGNRALAVMERRLQAAEWLAGRSFSVADIALYAYTHTAHEGGFDLGSYPGIRNWLGRVRGLPGHVTIDRPA